MRTTTFSALCINLHLLSTCAFTTPSQTTSRRSIILASEPATPVAAEAAPVAAVAAPVAEAATPAADAATPDADAAAADKPAVPGKKNQPTWEVNQHLYGLDMIKEMGGPTTISVTVGADGEEAPGAPLPMPDTYITCGQCKSLFAIAEADLGNMGKGCRVKCSVCNNSWYQSRERLFDIPNDSHDILPAQASDLDRIARNLARDIPPMFMGVGKLYVGNLDFRTTPEELKNFFEENSDGDVSVCDVSVVKGPDGRSRGFAFVSFYEEADGKKGLACNEKECNGRELSVREPNN